MCAVTHPECLRWAVAARAERTGETYAALADELGLTYGEVRHWCARYGISRARVHVTPRVARRLDVLMARGRSVADMAEDVGVPERVVRSYVERHRGEVVW